MNAMRNASDVTLNTIPKLDDLSLPFAFKNVKALEMENASLLESNGELVKWKMQIAEERRREEEELREARERHRVERGRFGEPSCSREVDHRECV